MEHKNEPPDTLGQSAVKTLSDFIENVKQVRQLEHAAMYRNSAQSFEEFLDKYEELRSQKADTYYDFQGRKISREDGFGKDYEVWLQLPQLTHIKNRHPDFADWEKIPEVIEKGTRQELNLNRVTSGNAYLFTLPDKDKFIAVIASPVRSKKHGDRLVVITAFKNAETGINNWVQGFKSEKAASFQGSGGSPEYPSSRRSALPGSENGEQNIDSGAADVKPSNNTLYHADRAINAQERLEADARAWEKTVDEVAEKGLPQGEVRMLGQTPLIMRLLDSDPKAQIKSAEGGIFVSPHVFDNKHPNIGPFELKQIPRALADPIAIFNSESHPGDLVFMLEIKDKNGSSIVMPVELRSKHGRGGKEINRGKSVYAKDKELILADEAGQPSGKTAMPRDEWFIEQAKKNARYLNGQKFENWLTASGSNSLRVLKRGFNSTNSTGYKLFTENDLVKLKNANPELYHGEGRPQGQIGEKTELIGHGYRELARYELRELNEILASHDPENGFAKRSGYPENAQERPYHSDVGEQEKVLSNASQFEPGFLLTDSPGTSDGPPIISQDGIVLGGNSRTMSLGLVYNRNPQKAQAYREALRKKATYFGLDPAAVDGMKKPVLARVLPGKLSEVEMAKRSRLYNQNLTQALQAEAEAVSRARFVGARSIGALAEGISDGRSVAEFLAGAESADFAKILLDEGVLEQAQFSSLTNKNGSLNTLGKSLVQRVLRGLILPDDELLVKLPQKSLAALDAAIPGLARSRLRGEGFDLTGAFYEAMRLVAQARKNGRKASSLFAQQALMEQDPLLANPVIQALVVLFDEGNPREVRLRLEKYIAEADVKAADQNMLLARQSSPAEAFRKAFLEDMAYVGNKRLPAFRPDSNPRDAAVAWAAEKCGKGATVEKALKRIEKRLKLKKLEQAEKQMLMEHQKQLDAMSGALGVEKPKLPENWKDPEKLEIPEPKKPGEKGALPEETSIHENINLEDPDALLPEEVREQPIRRAKVEFDEETGRAAVTFFRSANLASAPHELFHIFRREIEETAKKEGASKRAKELWAELNKFAGVKEGEVWTVEMEENFANLGLRYLAEGKAPTESLRGLFERMKQWLMDIYQRLENIGAEISPEMRKVFDDMFTVPQEEANRMLRQVAADNVPRRIGENLADPEQAEGKFLPQDLEALEAEKKGALNYANELVQDARIVGEEVIGRFERERPELARELFDEERRELAAIEEAEKRLPERDELRRQAVECMVMGG